MSLVEPAHFRQSPPKAAAFLATVAFVIVAAPFAFAERGLLWVGVAIENGDVTETLKVKRNKVVELYDGKIEALHCGTDWLRRAVLTLWGDAGSACIVGAAARAGRA